MLLVKIKEVATRGSMDVRFAKGVKSEQSQCTIYGAYSSVAVKDIGKYFGNEECFIFGLMPVCRIYKKSHENTGSNFVYFNSGAFGTPADKPIGLGFGGKDPSCCRVWIDENMKLKSYSMSDNDDTYWNG